MSRQKKLCDSYFKLQHNEIIFVENYLQSPLINSMSKWQKAIKAED